MDLFEQIIGDLKFEAVESQSHPAHVKILLAGVELFQLSYKGHEGPRIYTGLLPTYRPSDNPVTTGAGRECGSIYIPAFRKRITIVEDKIQNKDEWLKAKPAK